MLQIQVPGTIDLTLVSCR